MARTSPPTRRELEAEADSLFHRGQPGAANAILLPLFDAAPTSYLASCIGRNLRLLGDAAAARGWLARAVAFEKPFPWSFYEYAALEVETGAIRHAAELTAEFLGQHGGTAAERGFNDTHCAFILGTAHACFDVDRAMATRLYAAAAAAGLEDYLSLLRRAEAVLQGGDAAAAEALLDSLQRRWALDPWGLLTLGQVHLQRGRPEAAAQAVRDAIALQPDNGILLVHAAHRLIDFSRLEEAEATLATVLDRGAQQPDLAAPAQALRLRLLARRRAASTLRGLLEAGDLDLGVVEEWLILDALYTLVRSSADLEGDMPAVAEALVARLATLVPGSIPAILATMHYLSLARRWDQAEALMAGLEGTPAAAHPDIQFRRFELACARQQLSTAGEIYRAHISTRALSGWEYASTLRFLAEAKLWPEAAATTRRMLEQGEAFPTGEHTLLQIIRRTASHRSMLAAIDGGAGDRQGGPGGGQKGWLAGFRQLLVDDLCVALGQVAVDDAAGRPLGVVSPANAFLVQPVPDPRQGAPERIAAFMCTNATYFLSALVFLASWARHRVATTTVDWYLFLDDDVPAAWDGIVAGFAERLSLPLRVQREQAFVPSGAELSESYGLFAGGHTLARAAYFRIYAAKHLMRTGLYRRAAYFDTDMLCRADLSDFFHLGLGGALIAARPEDQSAEVQEAATRNGLDPAQYFNSGVLLFDLSHPSMPERLERAVLVAELEPERLVFHDQCALNIAFAGATLLIEERFNHFLRPHRDDNGDPSASALVHFLDRPKPWDVTYVREYRAGWVAAAGMVRALLSPADYGAIAAVANGQKPARPLDPPPSLSLASQDGGRA